VEERLTGVWVDEPEDVKLQEKYWHILKQWNNFPKYHDFVHPNAKISAVFLRSNPNWLI
jgi:hypothetical protein